MPLSFIFFKHPSALWLAWLLAAFSAAAAAESPPAAALSAAQIQDVSLLAGTCANCHGPDGQAPGGSAIRSLRGQSANHLQQRLLAFKAGTVADATVMTRLMKGYDAAHIEALAQWFGSKEAK
ncbi:c-type cytochrome [Simplicispira psychrophila]|uniref:c-type cytochrome n=1 Tax=Simplicispira psychrophila TaxID=80882 RepID=UPI000482A813|nr:hypothetical protein [Simplicispira psychrophila]